MGLQNAPTDKDSHKPNNTKGIVLTINDNEIIRLELFLYHKLI